MPPPTPPPATLHPPAPCWMDGVRCYGGRQPNCRRGRTPPPPLCATEGQRTPSCQWALLHWMALTEQGVVRPGTAVYSTAVHSTAVHSQQYIHSHAVYVYLCVSQVSIVGVNSRRPASARPGAPPALCPSVHPSVDPYAICVDPCVNQPRSMRAVTSARRAMGAVAMGASPPPRCSRSAAASVRLPPAVNQALQLGQ
uniref:Uncharacterized protein n=1 Tax=Haptolina brevifila TaxID=156173 RepID=A0A7S2DKC1_9EUKA